MPDKKSIAVIGSGYVGTVVAACLADVGRTVVGVEIDPDKRASLSAGIPHFYEKDLEHILKSAIDSGRLRFTDDFADALDESTVVFLCVDTPPGHDGHPDMRSVQAAARSIGRSIKEHHVIVTKSTVPVGSGNWLETTIAEELPDGCEEMINVVSNPEFLREGSAVRDFLHPDRVVVGGDCQKAVDEVVSVYDPILKQSFAGGDASRLPQLVTTGRATAETIKYAANAFLATKISFINEIALVCETVGADVTEVAHAIGLDSRIGPSFLNAGVGWGGSCFGKDTAALASMAREQGIEPLILDAVREVNQRQRHLITRKLQRHLRPLRGARVTLLGLAFKPGTDDVRDSPALTVAASLQAKGVLVRACDPMVTELDEIPELCLNGDPYAGAKDADAVVLMTEWPDFVELDFVKLAEQMRGKTIIDARNALDPQAVVDAGLTYEGIGRHIEYPA